MSRRFLGFGLVAAVVVASIFFVGRLFRPAPAAFPEPVRLVEPSGCAPGFDPSGEGRDQYIERRHGGAGVDWRRMDRESRDRIKSRRQALIRALKQDGRLDRRRAIVETFPLDPAELRGAPIIEGFTAEPDGLCGV